MILSYSRPTGIDWTIEGTGAAYLTDPARLTNGRPSSFTRIQWLSGSQTTSSNVVLKAQWSPASPAPDPYSTYLVPVNRVVALIGVTLPVGTRITAGLLYTKETRVIQRSDGVRMAVFYFPPGTTSDMDAATDITIYNDIYGSAAIAADSTFEIGEVWIGPSVEWCIRPTYESGREDFSKMKETLFGQLFRTARRAAAISQIEVTPVLYSQTWGALEENQIRIAQDNYGLTDIRERLLGYAPCLIVPITGQPYTGASPDPDFINRHAEFGYVRSMGPVLGEAPRWVFSANFKAPPPYLPTGNQ